MQILKKISLVILVIGYFAAGINHFRNPESYLHIIPAYLLYPVALNLLSGALEILFALLLVSVKTRKLGAYGVIILLVLFLPVHIQMVIDAPFQLGTFVVTPLLAWIRLVVMQPVLIAWAWWHRE